MGQRAGVRGVVAAVERRDARADRGAPEAGGVARAARAPEPRAARDVQQGRVLRGVQGLRFLPLLGWRSSSRAAREEPRREPPLVGLRRRAVAPRGHDALQGLVERGRAPPLNHVVELAPPQIEDRVRRRRGAEREPPPGVAVFL